ncbi:MAG: MFS transporter [Alphaproteobacteria bacterium]|nr:MFS transporter [Alphaproteobacteria bacterium]
MDADPVPSPSISPTAYLFSARAVRDFGDGFVAILLPAYLTALGFSAIEVGVLATVALLGSSFLTLGAGMIGGRHDQRRLLIVAAGLMVASGVAFALVHDFAVLLLVAFVGTINPSSGTGGVFAPLEQTILSRETADRERTRMFARYSLTGALAGAVGALASASPDYLAHAGFGQVQAIRAMFVVYAALGLLGGFLYSRIPPRPPAAAAAPMAALGPSKGIVVRLAVLFSLDSFGSGFAVQSLLALWLFERFDLSLAAAGLFFFWSGLLAAFSFPVAAWLSRRIGLINTMVYTHIPANLCLIAAAVVPSLPVVLALLLIRAALSQMDVPTRTSYVMAVVTEAERPAAASFTVVPRSLTAAISPAIAGALYAASFTALPLIIAGVLKTAYDLLLLFQFRHVKPPEER